FFQCLMYNFLSPTQRHDFYLFRQPLTFALFMIRAVGVQGLLRPMMKLAAKNRSVEQYTKFVGALQARLEDYAKSPAGFFNQQGHFTEPACLVDGKERSVPNVLLSP